MDTYLAYLSACIFMGIGIGADVAVATLAMTRVISASSSRVWVRRISLTHIVFPMLGYYVFAGLARSFVQVHVVLGLAAATMIGVFIVQLVRDWLDTVPQAQEQAPEANWVSWPLVLAVSYDALYSGPAKSAQALYWSPLEIFVSFFLSGAVVWLIAELTSRLAMQWQPRLDTLAVSSAARIGMWLMFAELFVLSYFFVLSLVRYVAHSELSGLTVLGITLILVGLLWVSCYGRLRAHATASAAQVLLA